MKAAIVKIVYVIIGVLIIMLVLSGLIISARNYFFEKNLEQMRRFQTYKTYKFDINDLLVDPNDPKTWDANVQSEYYFSVFDEPAFCKDLKNCIEVALKEGKCLISYKVRPGVYFNPDDVLTSIKSFCKLSDIKEELYGGRGRKLCEFKPISIKQYNKFSEDNITLINYQPYIHNCYLDDLGTHNVLDGTDQINYFYSGRGTESGYSFENGGTVRIVMTNVSIVEDFDATCSYSLYICGQNAIATSEDETPVQIFKKIRSIGEGELESELYYNEKIVWGNILPTDREDVSFKWFWNNILRPLIRLTPPLFVDIGEIPYTIPVGYNIYGYNPRTYEFTFLSNIARKDLALIDAIDAGMWEWSKSHYSDKDVMKYFLDAYYPEIEYIYFSYSPIVNVSLDNSIDFDVGCWNINYENSDVDLRTKLIFDQDTFTKSTSLYHNFNFNNFNIGKKIRMVLGIKKIFITKKLFKYEITWEPFKTILSLLGIKTSWTVNILDMVNDKYKLNLKPRVILVLDPVTICSE